MLTARRRENSATPKSAFKKNSDQEQKKDNKAWRRYNILISLLIAVIHTCICTVHGVECAAFLNYFWGTHVLYKVEFICKNWGVLGSNVSF